MVVAAALQGMLGTSLAAAPAAGVCFSPLFSPWQYVWLPGSFLPRATRSVCGVYVTSKWATLLTGNSVREPMTTYGGAFSKLCGFQIGLQVSASLVETTVCLSVRRHPVLPKQVG
jgi:hypothetical protein